MAPRFLHAFDSQDNCNMYMQYVADELTWLHIPKHCDVLNLWHEHGCTKSCRFKDTENPLIEITSWVEAMPKTWQFRVLHMFKAAFPEYSYDALSLPDILLIECVQAHWWRAHGTHNLLFAEAFSGQGELHQAVARALKVSEEDLYKCAATVRVDRKYTQSLDFSTTDGFRAHILIVRSISKLMWWGIECLTWIWVARSSFRRSYFAPNGDESMAQVLQANHVRDYACAACALLFWCGRDFIIEQPQSSLLNLTEEMRAVISLSGALTITTQHGAFETDETAPTKPLKLFGTPAWLSQLQRRCPDNGAKRIKLSIKVDGKVKGHKDLLSQSEHYSREFGDAVAALFVQKT